MEMIRVDERKNEMTRTLAIFSVGAVFLASMLAPLAVLKSGMLVLGGRYHFDHNDSLKKDVNFYFAQVTIEEGADVDGQVFLFSSTLDLAGHVTEDVHAFESDLTLRKSARVDGEIGEKDNCRPPAR